MMSVDLLFSQTEPSNIKLSDFKNSYAGCLFGSVTREMFFCGIMYVSWHVFISLFSLQICCLVTTLDYNCNQLYVMCQLNKIFV